MQKHQECSAHSPSSTLKDLVMDSLRDTKGQSISVLDVSDRTCITDMMIIASGTSTRHLRSLADNLIKACRQDGIQPLGVEGHSQSEWVLVDLGGIVVHLMMPSTRQFYDLERLWETRSPALLANAE